MQLTVGRRTSSACFGSKKCRSRLHLSTDKTGSSLRAPVVFKTEQRQQARLATAECGTAVTAQWAEGCVEVRHRSAGEQCSLYQINGHGLLAVGTTPNGRRLHPTLCASRVMSLIVSRIAARPQPSVSCLGTTSSPVLSPCPLSSLLGPTACAGAAPRSPMALQLDAQ